jgi:hypothetical protein
LHKKIGEEKMFANNKRMIVVSLSCIGFLCVIVLACTYDTQRTDGDCNGTDTISCTAGSYQGDECLVCSEAKYGGGYFCTCISGEIQGRCGHSTSGMCHKERTSYRDEYSFDVIYATSWNETPNQMCVIET